MYISEHSGHHAASLSIEKALIGLDQGIKTLNINSFNYTNPILEKVINKAYMGVVRRKPEIWDYLYDNPRVVRRTQKLRDLIHRFNTGKLEALINDFKADAVVCTQAFPCGMIADYKKSLNIKLPLVGVLTDYAPHSYWVYNNVDKYVVPSEDTGSKLVHNGIDPLRVVAYGIPIHPKFQKSLDRKSIFESLGLGRNKNVILIMGGTQGLGPIREMVKQFEKSRADAQLVIATGTNKKLFEWLSSRKFRKKVLPIFNAANIEELMEISSLVVTKAGGITIAESLAKGLPMLIANPLPGQESMNTRYLLKEGVAIKAEHFADVPVLADELLYNRDKLRLMRERALCLAKPDSALKTAKLIVELIDK